MHSCGKVNEIVEGYIQAGVNVVNLQQPRALGIREMGDRYRGRIAFESLADIQATLPTGDLARVDADAGVEAGQETVFHLDLRKTHVFEPGDTGRNLSALAEEAVA